MKLKKVAAVSVAVTMSIGIFTGCGNSKAVDSKIVETEKAESTENNNATEKPKEAENITLKVSTWDLEANPSVKNVVKAFEEKNPNIKVDLIDIASADYTQKLSVMLNGGSELDAFWIKDADTTKSLFDKGQITDLKPYIEKDGVDLEGYNGLVDNFVMPGGEIVGLPARTDYYVLYYNKDIFDAARVAYPSNDMTWEEFEETAKKITTGEGSEKKYGALIHTWQACVANWGVQDGKHTIMDIDYSFLKPYYEMVLRMQNEDQTIMDYATLKTGNIHYSSPFLTGNVGMMPMGSWFMTTIIAKIKDGESSVNWGVATLPHAQDVEAGYTVGAATPIVMNTATTHEEAAWEFIKFVTGKEGAQIYAEAGAIPGRANPETLNAITSLEGMPEGVSEALTVKNISFDRPMADKVAEIDRMMGEEHSMIMLGEVSIDEGLATMAERSKEIQGK
ncbi:MAG: ABC transporter substrate-binding protein [Zhenhengia sp.]|uniref:ABC transporter substrate-binding protein n=1 Tax=Zhenhengia sp. TaxID=2944208 RepID=UPI00290E4776|nr:sugar ABC transporter substrate-binding protein [Clostridiales bacterium]MDU6975853.1 sugar ABC transporter substrate-binding protein [Clostridiales bacterium]